VDKIPPPARQGAARRCREDAGLTGVPHDLAPRPTGNAPNNPPSGLLPDGRAGRQRREADGIEAFDVACRRYTVTLSLLNATALNPMAGRS